MLMIKKIGLISLFLATSFLLSLKAWAVCPVCVVAVGFGVGLSRYLGVDDVLTGIWIGGMLLSLSLWTIDWFKKKKWRPKFRNIIVIAFYYLLTIIPLYYSGIIGHPFNKFLGIDKLIFGIVLGTIGLYAGNVWYQFLKKKNNGHAYFPFQKVVMPVSILIILNIIFYFLTK